MAPQTNEKSNPVGLLRSLEAPPGIEPGIEVLQTFALPLGHSAVQLSAKPTILSYFLSEILVAVDVSDLTLKLYHNLPVLSSRFCTFFKKIFEDRSKFDCNIKKYA